MNGWVSRAEQQYGIITRAQMRADGLSDRRVDGLLKTGRVERVFAGVFRVAGSFRSERQRAMAVCSWCGPSALLSHATAGSLLQLPVSPDPLVHVTVPRSVRRVGERVRIHRTDTLAPRDRTVVDGLPTTSPVRTIIDLAAAVDRETLELLFETARRHGIVTRAVFTRRCDELCRQGRTGSGALRDLLRVVAARPSESRLEVKVARLLRRRELPKFAAQHRVATFRLDFAWPDVRVAVECDGFAWHGHRLAWKRDRRRIAALEAMGWRVVHLTWDDVTVRPCESVDRVRRALRLIPT